MLTAQAQTALRCSIDVDQTRQVREGDGIIFNQHHDGDGEIVFEHACAPGCEGIVSERLDFALSSRPLQSLAEGHETDGARCQARGRRGLELIEPAPMQEEDI